MNVKIFAKNELARAYLSLLATYTYAYATQTYDY